MQSRARSGGRAAPRLPISGSGLIHSAAGLRTALVLLLLALLVQGIAVQTHLHFAQQARALAATSSVQQVQVSKPDQNGPAADCPLCQEATTAGAYLLPPATTLPSPPATVLWVAAASLAEFGLRAPAQGWRSRAPPR
jgi:hypothetical protein